MGETTTLVSHSADVAEQLSVARRALRRSSSRTYGSRPAFVIERSSRPVWRCTKVMGERIYYQQWKYQRGGTEVYQCGAIATPAMLPVAARSPRGYWLTHAETRRL